MFEISKSILDQAVNCDQNYACLKNSGSNCCKTDFCVNDKILFIKDLKRECSYSKSFGYSYICNCPVRMEIFNKYKH
jgi:hypothetical protein